MQLAIKKPVASITNLVGSKQDSRSTSPHRQSNRQMARQTGQEINITPQAIK
jgi:hypothetical protein